MIHLLRTTSDSNDFQQLVHKLDNDLAVRNGDENAFFAQFNKIDRIRHVVIAYKNERPVGCGAVKAYSEKTVEVKRMFVAPELRGKGIASLILQELERWADEMYFERCILETGRKQPEAIRLYLKNKYRIIPNFGQYAGVESSVCFEKEL